MRNPFILCLILLCCFSLSCSTTTKGSGLSASGAAGSKNQLAGAVDAVINWAREVRNLKLTGLQGRFVITHVVEEKDPDYPEREVFTRVEVLSLNVDGILLKEILHKATHITKSRQIEMQLPNGAKFSIGEMGGFVEKSPGVNDESMFYSIMRRAGFVFSEPKWSGSFVEVEVKWVDPDETKRQESEK